MVSSARMHTVTHAQSCAHVLTCTFQMQITQFFVGILGTLGGQFFSDCYGPASHLVLTGIQIYAVGLIVLFTSFYSKKYKKN